MYKTNKNLTRRNRKSISYKITKPYVKNALELFDYINLKNIQKKDNI
jgi:hypothetical protein